MSTSKEIGERIEAMIPDVPSVGDAAVDHLCTMIAMLNERINLLEKRTEEIHPTTK